MTRRLAISHLTLAIVAGLALTACSQSAVQRTSAPTSAASSQQWFYPKGIVPPASYSVAVKSGIYPSNTAAQCCFLKGTAKLTLAKSAGSKNVTFSMYVPDNSYLRAHPERFTLTFVGSTSQSAVLHQGSQTVTFAFPKSTWTTTMVPSTLSMSSSYVPKQLGINDDIRPLSIMLISVTTH